jgi:hypothetical protein
MAVARQNSGVNMVKRKAVTFHFVIDIGSSQLDSVDSGPYRFLCASLFPMD